MLAVSLSLLYFPPIVQGFTILIATDSATVVAYLPQEGGPVSKTLCNLTIVMYNWAACQNVLLIARHIPGILNVTAARLSRAFPFSQLEWSLNWKVVKWLWNKWGGPRACSFRYSGKQQV